jgi:hypothetical protein
MLSLKAFSAQQPYDLETAASTSVSRKLNINLLLHYQLHVSLRLTEGFSWEHTPGLLHRKLGICSRPSRAAAAQQVHTTSEEEMTKL